MPDINFDCSNCGQNLDAPENMAGVTILCPSCKKDIVIPVPPKPVDPDAEDSLKGKTVRIDLPPDFEIPEPKRRIITIKRPD
jgi:DNA-directed RNA polymerase subunit RPC12/RpoP